MDETQARQRIRIAYSRLEKSQDSLYEQDAANDDQAVSYHINAIRSAGGGAWNDVIANDYVANLESQLEEEIVANDRIDDDLLTDEELDEEVGNQGYDRSM